MCKLLFKKRNYFYFFICLFFSSFFTSFGNSATSYELNYTKQEQYWSNPKGEYGKAIVVDDANNIYISGVHETVTPFLIKMDNNLNKLWNYSYSGVSAHANAQSMVRNSNGSIYIICNYVSSYSIRILHCDKDGNRIWTYYKTLRGCETWSEDSCITHNNEVIIGGYIYSSVNQAFILKMDADGKELWNVTFSPVSESCFAYSIAVDSLDNIYALIRSYTTPADKIYLAKFDPSGAQLWNNTLSENDYLYAGDIIISDSDDIYVVYNYNDYSTEGFYILEKYSCDGDFYWSRNYEDPDHQPFAVLMKMDKENNIILVINYYDVIKDETVEIYELVVLNSTDGDIRYRDPLQFEPGSDNAIYDLTVDNNNNIFLAGSKVNPETDNFDVYVVKYYIATNLGDGDDTIVGFDVFIIICGAVMTILFITKKINLQTYPR